MYVYEVFVEECVRGTGVAYAMMTMAEQMCRQCEVECIMLTVFEQNTNALRLYKDKLKYIIDQSTPSRWGYHDTGYEILSKRIPPATNS